MTEIEFKQIILPLREQMTICAMRIMGNQDDALDVLQESLATLWGIRSRLDGIDNLKAYCIRVVRNTAIKGIQIRRTIEEIPIEEGLPLTSCEDLEAEQTAGDKERNIRKLIATLAPREREVITLSGFQGLSNEEICEATGLKDQNVRTILSRARRRLREMMDNNDMG